MNRHYLGDIKLRKNTDGLIELYALADGGLEITGLETRPYVEHKKSVPAFSFHEAEAQKLANELFKCDVCPSQLSRQLAAANKLETENANLKRDIYNRSIAILVLKAELAKAKLSAGDLHDEVAQLRRSRRSLRGMLTQCRNAIAAQKNELEAAQDELKIVSAELADARAKYEWLKEEYLILDAEDNKLSVSRLRRALTDWLNKIRNKFFFLLRHRT